MPRSEGSQSQSAARYRQVERAEIYFVLARSALYSIGLGQFSDHPDRNGSGFVGRQVARDLDMGWPGPLPPQFVNLGTT